MYAEDIDVTTQSTDFAPIEETLTSALDGVSEYPTTNQLGANPTKTQVSLFHLRNRECGKQLNISWNGVKLTHYYLHVYLGVTLDRTLSYKAHIEKTNKKVGTRKNIIRKLRTSKSGATPTTLRSSALSLCYSSAEYACPVWERSTHAQKLDAILNETCRMITGCLKPTHTNSLPVLAGIAPSEVGFSNGQETCDCGNRLTMQHLLVCPMMDTVCSHQDLTTANDIAIGCARHWEDTI